jgi:hypothetical protein
MDSNAGSGRVRRLPKKFNDRERCAGEWWLAILHWSAIGEKNSGVAIRFRPASFFK